MTDRWINAAGGSYETAPNWSNGVPGNEIAVFGQVKGSATPHTVTVDDPGGGFYILVGLQTAANATVDVSAGGQFVVSASAGTTVTNRGVVDASGAGSEGFLGAAGHLNNYGTLEASGAGASFGIQGGTMMNSGTVDVSGSNAFFSVASGTLKNLGLMTASGSGATLLFEFITVNNSGGTIGTTAGSSATVDLSNGTVITGGTLEGSIQADSSSTSFAVLRNVTLSDAAGTTVEIPGGAGLVLQGTITNKSLILTKSQISSGANLYIGGTVTLNGGGTVELAPGGLTPGINNIFGSSSGGTLNNVDNLIEGEGTIQGGSGGGLTLNDEIGGVIEALGNTAVDLYNLAIATGHQVVNAGTIESSSNATLQIDDAVRNTGTIAAQLQHLNVLGAVTGTGRDQINGATLEFGSSVGAGQAVSFVAGAGTLKLDDATAFHGTVAGLTSGDSIDIAGFDFGTLKPLKFTENGTNTGGTLVVNDGTHNRPHCAYRPIRGFRLSSDQLFRYRH
jgi:hypothetical protein